MELSRSRTRSSVHSIQMAPTSLRWATTPHMPMGLPSLPIIVMQGSPWKKLWSRDSWGVWPENARTSATSSSRMYSATYGISATLVGRV